MDSTVLSRLPTRTRSAIDWMVDRIVNHVHPRQVILFGSYARGDAGPESDVDLLVVMDLDPAPGTKRHTTVAIYHALKERDLPVDVVVATPEEMRVRRYIPGTIIYPAVREGALLYERP